MFKIEFDDSGLRQLERNLEAIAGTREVPFTELFPPTFMTKHTKFTDISVFCEESGYDCSTPLTFSGIPEDAWDLYVKSETDFGGWEEMKNVAVSEWLSRQLNR